jgi:hypothetical protein
MSYLKLTKYAASIPESLKGSEQSLFEFYLAGSGAASLYIEKTVTHAYVCDMLLIR